MTGQRAMMGTGVLQTNIKDWADHHVLARDAHSSQGSPTRLSYSRRSHASHCSLRLDLHVYPDRESPDYEQIYTNSIT
ncbi:hypothetical protein CLOP_g20980 [Closterium sp. NIES-67]|nr:hypothetical protein CLOP_g20980 [Closterium sp. NIES-67]